MGPSRLAPEKQTIAAARKHLAAAVAALFARALLNGGHLGLSKFSFPHSRGASLESRAITVTGPLDSPYHWASVGDKIPTQQTLTHPKRTPVPIAPDRPLSLRSLQKVPIRPGRRPRRPLTVHRKKIVDQMPQPHV